MLIPMDGSAVKVPYLYIKVFDGKAIDVLKVFNPLEELHNEESRPCIPQRVVLHRKEETIEMNVQPAEDKMLKVQKLQKVASALHSFRFVKRGAEIRPALVLRPVDIKPKEMKQQPKVKELSVQEPLPVAGVKTEAPRPKPAKIPEMPEPRRIVLPRPVQPKTPVQGKAKESMKLQKARRKTSKTQPPQLKPRKKRKRSSRKKITRRKKRIRRGPRPRQPLKEELIKNPRKMKQKSPETSCMENPLNSKKRKRPAGKAAERPKKRRRRASAVKAKRARKPRASPKSKSKKRKSRKKLHPHFRKQMLGLYKRRKTSGRARAGSSL